MELLNWARDLAEQLLADPLPRRWAHSQGVGRRAESLADVLGDDAELLAVAAWLHDIGYAPELVKTGMHHLDGARYLRDVARADPRICSLVAHHSCACIEARNRGMHAVLEAEFPPVGGLLADALTYSDMTTTPDGHTTEVEDRLAEILVRYEAGTIVFDSISEARPQIISAAHAVSDLILNWRGQAGPALAPRSYDSEASAGQALCVRGVSLPGGDRIPDCCPSCDTPFPDWPRPVGPDAAGREPRRVHTHVSRIPDKSVH